MNAVAQRQVWHVRCVIRLGVPKRRACHDGWPPCIRAAGNGIADTGWCTCWLACQDLLAFLSPNNPP